MHYYAPIGLPYFHAVCVLVEVAVPEVVLEDDFDAICVSVLR